MELQAMVASMNLFDTYLRGRRFTIFTDHKLFGTQSKHPDKTNDRLTEAFLKYNFVF
jgi:hypothetical protein